MTDHTDRHERVGGDDRRGRGSGYQCKERGDDEARDRE
jgi:hypothetical protein